MLRIDLEEEVDATLKVDQAMACLSRHSRPANSVLETSPWHKRHRPTPVICWVSGEAFSLGELLWALCYPRMGPSWPKSCWSSAARKRSAESARTRSGKAKRRKRSQAAGRSGGVGTQSSPGPSWQGEGSAQAGERPPWPSPGARGRSAEVRSSRANWGEACQDRGQPGELRGGGAGGRRPG